MEISKTEVKKRALVFNPSEFTISFLIKTLLGIHTNLGNCDSFWITMPHLKYLDKLIFYINGVSRAFTKNYHHLSIYVISRNERPVILYPNVYYLHNSEEPLLKDEHFFFIWNIDQDRDIEKALGLGYKKFYSSFITDDKLLNINHYKILLITGWSEEYAFVINKIKLPT